METLPSRSAGRATPSVRRPQQPTSRGLCENSPMAKIPVLLDTDPGSDIDDALALAYLASHSGCELVGVTTVSGVTEERAAIAEIVLREFGQPNVPVVAGADLPLAHGPGQPAVPHYEAVRDWEHRLDYPRHQAVDFLRRTIRERPGEITLLTVGPLTNIAILFALDPEIPYLVKETVSMLGSFFRDDKYEWNAVVDPMATEVVLKRSVNHTLIGLDVTLQCKLPNAEALQRLETPTRNTLRAMTQKWAAHASDVTFHDPLAAAILWHRDLCEYEVGTAFVPAPTPERGHDGRTEFTPSPDGPHRAARTVDAPRFFAEYFGVTKE